MISPLCPSCRVPLQTRPDASRKEAGFCPRCKTGYPQLGTIPLFLEHPDAVTRAWTLALRKFTREVDRTEQVLLTQLLEEELTQRSRARLRLMVSSLPAYRDAIVAVFQENGFCPAPDERLPAEKEPSSILAYYTLLFRDYAWAPEVDEVTPALASIRGSLPTSARMGNVLVLGAGTARLAWDLCSFPGVDSVTAIDINPLPFLITDRLLRGISTELWELPAHPRRSSFAAKKWTLQRPETRPFGLRLMFADALAPPFPPGSFDCIVTPWFIDQLPVALGAFIGTVSELLVPGGLWLNHGPLIYEPQRTPPALRHAADEVMDLLPRFGFSTLGASYEPSTYLASPLSTQGRLEHVLTFVVRKIAEAKHRFVPEFLRTGASGDLVVPVLRSSASADHPHPMLRRLTAVIDGQRTVDDLTSLLISEGWLADDATAVASVRGALRILWRDEARDP